MKKSVISVLSALAGAALGAGASVKLEHKKLIRAREMSEKHLALFLLMNQWVICRQEGKDLSAYFEKNGFRRIAVYGMSYAGKRLIDELKDTAVTVAYGIDRRADSLSADVDIVSGDDALETVDAIVVTAITFFDQIAETLRKKTDCPIVSLEDILYEI